MSAGKDGVRAGTVSTSGCYHRIGNTSQGECNRLIFRSALHDVRPRTADNFGPPYRGQHSIAIWTPVSLVRYHYTHSSHGRVEGRGQGLTICKHVLHLFSKVYGERLEGIESRRGYLLDSLLMTTSMELRFGRFSVADGARAEIRLVGNDEF